MAIDWHACPFYKGSGVMQIQLLVLVQKLSLLANYCMHVNDIKPHIKIQITLQLEIQ